MQTQMTIRTKPSTVANQGRFTVKLRSVGNPDYGQYTSISDTEMLICDSVEECVQGARRYIEENDLGGGNWPRTYIVKDGQKTAQVAYNGSLWSPKGYPHPYAK